MVRTLFSRGRVIDYWTFDVICININSCVQYVLFMKYLNNIIRDKLPGNSYLNTHTDTHRHNIDIIPVIGI